MAEMISKQHLLEQIDTTGKGCEYEGKEFLVSPPDKVVEGCPSLIYPNPTSCSTLILFRI